LWLPHSILIYLPLCAVGAKSLAVGVAARLKQQLAVLHQEVALKGREAHFKELFHEDRVAKEATNVKLLVD